MKHLLSNISVSLSAVSLLLVMVSASSCSEKKSDGKTRVLIETSYGNMVAELYDATPKHRDNFLKLVAEGFYDDVLFHRVINEFMIQGGDPTSKNAPADAILGEGGPGYTIEAEIRDTLFHRRGALAAARMGDDVNPMKESSGSQFYFVQGKKYTDQEIAELEQNLSMQKVNAYRNEAMMAPECSHLAMEVMSAMKSQNKPVYDSIMTIVDSIVAIKHPSIEPFKYSAKQIEIYKTVGGTPHLDGGYTVFGQVVEGLEVIDKIAAVQTVVGDRPAKNIPMKISIKK